MDGVVGFGVGAVVEGDGEVALGGAEVDGDGEVAELDDWFVDEGVFADCEWGVGEACLGWGGGEAAAAGDDVGDFAAV